MARMTRRKDLVWLAPQPQAYGMTIRDIAMVRDADAHAMQVHEWARHVWSAWERHHATMRAWAEDVD